MLLDERQGARLPPVAVCIAMVLMVFWAGASIRISAGGSAGIDQMAIHALEHAARHSAAHQ